MMKDTAGRTAGLRVDVSLVELEDVQEDEGDENNHRTDCTRISESSALQDGAIQISRPDGNSRM
jgi:hypothetical protein